MPLLSPTPTAAIGITSLLAFELVFRYSAQYLSFPTAVSLRIEWLSWGVLYIVSRARLFSVHHDSTKAADYQARLSFRSTLTSVYIVVAQTVRHRVDASWILPIIPTVLLVLSRSALFGGSLPVSEGARDENTLGVVSSKRHSGSRTLRRRSLFLSGFVGAFTSLALFFPFPPVLTVYTCVTTFCFLVLQIFTFVFLPCEMEKDGSDANAGENGNAFFWRGVSGVSGRVFLCFTVILVVFPGSFVLSKEVVILSALNSAQWAAILILCFVGSPVTASALAVFARCSVESLIASTATASSLLTSASLLTLSHVIYFLPSSARRRGVLSLFILVPLFGFMQADHFSQWMTATNGAVDHSMKPSESLGLKDIFSGTVHPVKALAEAAKSEFATMLNRQSRTLPSAISEYKRRYKRPPPPGFDTWYAEAIKTDFLLIDEFDGMMESFEPFWGIPPFDLRARVESALTSSPDYLIRYMIRNHKVEFREPPSDKGWMGGEIKSWFSNAFLNILPDMDFAINGFDEPRVSAPHDAIEAALQASRDSSHGSSVFPAANKIPVDFSKEGRERTWQDVTLSCRVDSPARNERYDTRDESVEGSNLGFVLNTTSHKDVCAHPELRVQHGFFASPETLELTHTLVPIFSQCKPSTFQDLLYPSPFYSNKYRQHEYNETEDIDWDLKENKVYWTGSTTGGYTTNETWQHFHRQRMHLLTHGDSSQSITVLNRTSNGLWKSVTSTMDAVSSLFNTRITNVIQCEAAVCEIQRKALQCPSEQIDSLSTSYRYRLNLDLDGNAFSGRFYRLLLSKVVPVKQTVFKEWHDDWLVPWVHYVPLSMEMTELPEVVRYLTTEMEGLLVAKEIADAGRQWARKVLRKKDFELVFMRLLLEYARVISPAREDMGCCG